MIKIIVTIEEHDDGLTIKQIGSAGQRGASDRECKAADTISQHIHISFDVVEKEEREKGVIHQDVVVPYTRVKRRKDGGTEVDNRG